MMHPSTYSRLPPAQGALEIRLAVQALAPHHLQGTAPGGSGLQALALSVLGIEADKSLQCSPWHHRHLTQVLNLPSYIDD